MRTRATLLSLTAVAALALAGCGSDSDSDAGSTPTPSTSTSTSPSTGTSDSPSASPSEDAGPVVNVTIKGDEITPLAKAVELKVGQPLTVNVTSDRAGELHVHSTPTQSFEIAPGSQTFSVTVDKPGSVDMEEEDTGTLVIRALVR